MKPHINRLLFSAFTSLATFTTAQAQITWNGGGGNSNWSTTGNWNGGNVPDINTEVAQYGGAVDVSITVDQNFTINSFVDGFSGETRTATIGGTSTLTINRNSTALGVGIDNATGSTGGTLRFTGNVTINNTAFTSGNAVTTIRNANSSGNITRFDTTSNLTLTTWLETVNSAGGQIQFNGTLAASTADLRINSNNVSFGTGHNSSSFGRDVVMFANSKVTVSGGTVLNAGRKFQVNGTGASIQLDGANAINGANINVGGTFNFLMDVNSNQTNMGTLSDIGGGFTIDLDSSVTSLFFSDSSAFESAWSGGSIGITGFRENVIKFGSTSSGLTSAQLSLINGGIYSLSSSGYLTAIPEPSAFAALAGLGALGLTATRRRRRRV